MEGFPLYEGVQKNTRMLLKNYTYRLSSLKKVQKQSEYLTPLLIVGETAETRPSTSCVDFRYIHIDEQ